MKNTDQADRGGLGLKCHSGDYDYHQKGKAHENIKNFAVESLRDGVFENGQVFHDFFRCDSVDRRWRGAGRSTPGSAATTVSRNKSSNVCRFSTRWRMLKPRERSRSTTGSIDCPSAKSISQNSPRSVAGYPF